MSNSNNNSEIYSKLPTITFNTQYPSRLVDRLPERKEKPLPVHHELAADFRSEKAEIAAGRVANKAINKRKATEEGLRGDEKRVTKTLRNTTLDEGLTKEERKMKFEEELKAKEERRKAAAISGAAVKMKGLNIEDDSGMEG